MEYIESDAPLQVNSKLGRLLNAPMGITIIIIVEGLRSQITGSHDILVINFTSLLGSWEVDGMYHRLI